MNTKTTRLNLELRPEVKERLEQLRKSSHASSSSEVIRRSLALYELVIDHIRSEGNIVLEHKDGTKEKLTILS